ncbi:MAG: hypothetical protein DRO40_00955 [Thermoprotei archaeon]|nr:MAG: hypothetical protein DRO40_00955 [Thermoprotei archaeon]
MSTILRPIIEVKPKSLVDNREPNLIEQPVGLPEKEQSFTELPPLFNAKEGFRLYTHASLMPVVYTYDRERGIIVVRDIYKPLPFGLYEVNSIGGERIKKTAEIGIIYINTSPYTIFSKVSGIYSGFTKDFYKITLNIEKIKVKISDPTKFVNEMWKRYYRFNEEVIKDIINETLLSNLKYMIVSKEFEDIVYRLNEIEELAKELLRKELDELGIDVIKLNLSYSTTDDVIETFYWHRKHEIPVEYEYVLRTLNKIPDSIIDKAPEVPVVIVLSILARKVELLNDVLRNIVTLSSEEIVKRIVEAAKRKAGEETSSSSST